MTTDFIKLNELVGKIKKAYLYAQTNSTKAVLEDILPELKESKDERIRKVIYDWIYLRPSQFFDDGFSKEEMLAWLEKQGEQKVSYTTIVETGDGGINALVTRELPIDGWDGKQEPTDKVETKFHKGQWIVWQDECYKVNYNGCGYQLVDKNGLSILLDYGTIDENAHLWDVAKDAKDGDVLLFEGFYNSIVLFQGIGINGKGRINYHCKCDLVNYSFGVQGDFACLGTIEKDAEHYHPATKEQRDTLFAKMKEAGYKWDEDKKELKKTEQTPAWSEEDKNFMYDTLSNLTELKDRYGEGYGNVGKCIGWLKSLKDKYAWKPSDEQLDALQYVYRNSNPLPSDKLGWNSLKTLELMYHDLKKLKE